MRKKILYLMWALILSLVFPFYSRSDDIKLYEWKFNVGGVETDVDESIMSPKSNYTLLIDRVLIPVTQYTDSLIYISDLRGLVLNRFIVMDYIHSITISPSGDYIVIATMNDIPEGNPTKGKIHCYDKSGNKKWERNILGKPYLGRNVIAISEYKENITDPVTEEDSWTPSFVSFLNYQGKEIFKTAKVTKLAAISQDGNYFVTSYQGNTNLYHISGKTLWNQDIEGYVSLSQDGALICIGERRIDKEHTSREQRIKCLTKEGKTIWTDKMKTRYGVKIVMSLTGNYLLAYPSGIRPFEAGAYYSDKKEVVVYGNRGKQLWKFEEPVKNMGSFKQVLVSKNGSVAILSEEFLTEKGSVKKNDWVYFFNNKGKMLWKANKIGGDISLSDDEKYLVTGPYFYETGIK